MIKHHEFGVSAISNTQLHLPNDRANDKSITIEHLLRLSTAISIRFFYRMSTLLYECYL